MEGTLQSEGPWTLLAPTDAVLDDAGFNVRAVTCMCMRAVTCMRMCVDTAHIHLTLTLAYLHHTKLNKNATADPLRGGPRAGAAPRAHSSVPRHPRKTSGPQRVCQLGGQREFYLLIH